MRLASVGEITIDHYRDLDRRFVGGISLNFAVNAKRAGAREVSLMSCIGEDHAVFILDRLTREGVDATHVSIAPGKTAVQEINITANGERIFPAGGYHPGVLEQYRLSDQDFTFLRLQDVVASPCFTQLEELFDRVVNNASDGKLVADFLDLSDYDRRLTVVERYINRLKIAFVSGDQEMAEQLQALSRSTRCLIVVTLGEAGSVALTNGERIYQPSFPIAKVVDSTGCGDAFQAAFTVAYFKCGDIGRALQAGAEQAAIVLGHYGAIG